MYLSHLRNTPYSVRFLFASALLLLTSTARAQTKQISNIPRCGFDEVLKYYRRIDPDYQKRLESSYQDHASEKGTAQVYKIPVVFHVVYDPATPAQNLPDSVILNQLQVLNDAYRHRHKDTGTIRAIFKPLAADAQIEFYLATKDPQGNTTTGITRTQTSIPMFGDYVNDTTMAPLERIKKTAQGGIDPWPVSRYLNIWIADMSDITFGQIVLFGYATPPNNPLPPNWSHNYKADSLIQGVVIQYQVTGNNNPYNSQIPGGLGTAGRSAVHEVGHYLGLRHIWGDASPADSCKTSGDDGISDTPPQAVASTMNSTCPSASQNTCSGTTGDLPDMWEDYMDYSNDKCVTMFTAGQVSHMRIITAYQKDTLIGLVGIQQPEPTHYSISIYPQPASDEFFIRFDGPISSLKLTDVLGREVFVNRNADKRYDISGLANGCYVIQLRSGANTYIQKLLVQH